MADKSMNFYAFNSMFTPTDPGPEPEGTSIEIVTVDFGTEGNSDGSIAVAVDNAYTSVSVGYSDSITIIGEPLPIEAGTQGRVTFDNLDIWALKGQKFYAITFNEAEAKVFSKTYETTA